MNDFDSSVEGMEKTETTWGPWLNLSSAVSMGVGHLQDVREFFRHTKSNASNP
jgi:hypothetical protein